MPGGREKRYPLSDHCDGYTFKNQNGVISKSVRDLLRWQISRQTETWPGYVENKKTPALVESNSSRADEVFLTFINHVTFLIQCNGLNMLSDPVFSLRASPSQKFGPKRVRRPGLALQALPKIDLILLSHNHYDHMDLPALKFLSDRDRPVILTPLGNNQILQKNKIKGGVEQDWWDTFEFRNGSQIIATPAQHWSGRGVFDRNRALWSGFVIKFPVRKLYFAGDSGFGPHFSDIYNRLGAMDISLLPIGAYEPRWFMREQHMNPEEAVRAHIELHSMQSVGTHFGTFQLTDEGYETPVVDLNKSCEKLNIKNFTVLEVGETRKF